ncbi:MAG: hypothetical protein M3O55_07760 [Actinomycetota bacterium]|nr:hypothetical protein [Actinomycetota bacterium]
MSHADKHPEHIEPSWPAHGDGKPVNELAAEHQGAESPFGDDMDLPAPIERHGRHYVVRPPGSERHDTDFGGDESL